MERTADREPPPPTASAFTSLLTDFLMSLPLLAATAAIGGVLYMLFMLRGRVERQTQTFLHPMAAAVKSSTLTTKAAPESPATSATSSVSPDVDRTSACPASLSPLFFLDNSRKKMRLEQKFAISHDTHRFRFSLESPHQVLGLPIGKHMKLFVPAAACAPRDATKSPPEGEATELSKRSISSSTGEEGSISATAAGATAAGAAGAETAAAGGENTEEIERKYTPVTGDELTGYVDLVVKVYQKGQDPRYPEGGKMSQYLHSLQPGQYVDVQGPVGRIEYLGSGEFLVSRKPLPPKKRVGMLSGGTGITPMYQLINAVLSSSSDSTFLTLLYASKTEADILLKTELDALAEQHKDQLHVHYTVAAASASWPFYRGFIDKQMIEETMPPPATDTLILICGSPIMVFD